MSWEWKDEGENPALALPPEPPPEERKYKVVGPHEVFGHEPGSEFKATLSPAQEQTLIAAGHIQRQGTPRASGGTGGGRKPSESKGKE